MLSKAVADKVYVKLVLSGKTKRDLAKELNKSYSYIVNVLNRKKSSKSVELLLKNWSEQ